ncbi:MAG: hypothetical protein QOI95_1397 [Acidimicrobiaceae bacterium]
MRSWSLDRERVEKHALSVVLVLLVLPLAVTAVRLLLHGGANPGGDNALIELQVRDVGGHTPLLGSYGRYGFNQPGPLWFYVLAVPYRLLGTRYSGLQLGALLVSAAAVISIGVICRRRGDVVILLWSAVLLALLLHGLGPAWVADPWEPHAVTVACAALMLLAFVAATGKSSALPVTAAVASLLAQAQAGLVTFALAMLAVAGAGVVVRAFREGGTKVLARRSVQALLITVVVLAALWAPPLIALAHHDPGNLAAMWRSLRAPNETLGYLDAWRAVALQLGPRAPWLGFREPRPPFEPSLDVHGAVLLPIGLLALVPVLAVARHRRDKTAVIAGVVLLAILAAVLSLGRLLGPLFFWIPEWTRAIGMACWLAIGWCAYRSIGEPLRERVARFAIPGLLVALTAITVVNVAEALRHDSPDDPFAGAVHQLAVEALPSARSAGGAALVTLSERAAERFDFDTGLPTLVLDLERAHVDAVVDRALTDRFGAHRAEPDRATIEFRLLIDDEAIPSGFRVVASIDPLTPNQRADRKRLAAQLPVIPPNTSPAYAFKVFASHPELASVQDELGAIPDLPVLTLVERQITAS